MTTTNQHTVEFWFDDRDAHADSGYCYIEKNQYGDVICSDNIDYAENDDEAREYLELVYPDAIIIAR